MIYDDLVYLMRTGLTKSSLFKKVFKGRQQLLEIYLHASKIEGILNRGFTANNRPLKRIPLFNRVMGHELYGKKSSEMLSIVFDDFMNIDAKILSKLSGGREVLHRGDRILFDAASERHLFTNWSIGLLSKQANVFKRHAHTNHLVSRILDAPREFFELSVKGIPDLPSSQRLRIVLEEKYKAVRKIADVTIHVRLESFPFTRADGSMVHLMDDFPGLPDYPGFFLPASFDSKVLKDPARSLRGSFAQQHDLFYGDRLTLVTHLFKSMKSKGIQSSGEITEVLDQFIPAVFRHYVFIPKDFVDSGGSIAALYQRRMKEDCRAFLEKSVAEGHLQLSDGEMDLLEAALLKHMDDHFGNSHFLNSNSDMSYEFLPDALE